MRSSGLPSGEHKRHGFFYGLFLYKFRSYLPFRMAALMALTATLIVNVPYFQETPSTVVWGLLGMAGVACVGIRLMNVAHAENQMFGYIVVGVCFGWLLMIYLMGESATLSFSSISLAIVTAVFGGVFALDRRNLTTIKIQEKTRSWKENVERQETVGLKETRWEFYEETDFGWVGIMAWDGANNMVEKIIEKRRELETEWGEYRDTVSIEPFIDEVSGQVHSNKVVVRCVQTNPLAKELIWDGVVAKCVTESRPTAMYADAQIAMDKLWEKGIGGKHKLFAGASRSGKSVAMKQEIVTYGPLGAKDGSVAICLSDNKGGTSFMKYASMAAWTVTTPEDTVFMLEVLALITMARGAYVAARRDWGEVWEPGPGFPVILAYFDEISVVLDKDADSALQRRAVIAMKTIARMGMGLGVLLRVGVQEPTKEALGSMQILAQLVYRVCFRLQYVDRGKYAIPNLASKGVEPGNIPIDHKGECYIEDGMLNRTMKARWVNVRPEQETDTIKSCHRFVPEFAECDYADLAIGNGDSSVLVRDALRARRMYSIEEAPPAEETSDVIVDGYILRPPEERKMIDAAPTPPTAVDAPSTQPDAPLEITGGQVPTPSVTQRPTQPPTRDPDEVAAAREKALRGNDVKHRKIVRDALIEAGERGLSIKEMSQAVEAATAGQTCPSRGWFNKLMTEWRGKNPDKPVDPPLVIHAAARRYVWTDGAAPDPEAVRLEMDIDGDGVDDQVSIPQPPHQGWKPRLIKNEEDDDE